jgi:hypothetical protein
MKKIILLIFCIQLCCLVKAQYSVSQDVDRLFYCTPTTLAHLTGKAQSFNSNVFKGFKYHFYYYSSGVYTEIGNYTAQLSGSTMFTTYGNLNPTYFDGSQIGNPNALIATNTQLWISIYLPYSTFPNNNTGQQLAIDIEAIDQFGNTTTHSSKTIMSVPLLYTNPVTLANPTITSSSAIVCSGVNVQISSNPNYTANGFSYDWYKDGAAYLLSDNTGTITVSSSGTYYAIVSDACQTATSNSITINPGTVPAKPSITLPILPLCNGASGTLTANGTGGIYTWSTSATGSDLAVTTAGNYTVHESNACGASPESDPVTVTTASSPAAPTINSSAGNLLCNGGSTILSTTPSAGGTIHWSTGATGNTISVSVAGDYYAYESNSCGNSPNSNTITISVNATPPAPSLNTAGAVTICNGFGYTISTSPSAGGTIHWSNGATGNSITVFVAGNYYAYESNACGNGLNSATVIVNTINTPSAPIINPAGPLVLCDGATTTLTSSGTVPANILWYFNGSSTGHFGTTYTVSSVGSYTTKELSSCGTSLSSNAVVITTNNTPPTPNLNISGTILLCDGASQTILTTPSTSGGVIHWSTGATGNSIMVSAAGNYYAYESNPSCGNSSNSVAVTITTLNKPIAPTVNPPTNQLLCNGANATLTSTGANITWSNGVTGNILVTGVAGTYYAYDQNSCGNSANSSSVVIGTGTCPTPNPGSSFFICPGTQKTLDAGAGYDTYLWSTGATTQTISVGPGSYTVTVLKNGCYATSLAVSVSYYSVGAALINLSGTTTFCSGGSVTLTASAGNTFVWSTGATTQSIIVNTSGTYYVTVTDANGCQATSASVITTVHALPTASIAGSVSLCQNSAAPQLTFNASGGTGPYTFTYKINGGVNQTITTISGNSIALSIPTSLPGTYTYSLVSVQESSSTACINPAVGSATVVVNPLPTASITGTTTLCQNGASPIITFTGNSGTAPYTFVYNINGGANQTITTISGNSISVNAPTTTPGSFAYSLVSVQDASSTACSNTANGTANVLINPLPSATILGNTTVCQNSTQPQIIFTGSAGTPPYTFSYKINGGAVQTVNTSTGNGVAVNVPTGASGTFTYSLVSVQESSGTSCSSGVTGTATVVINPLPTATIAGSTTVCQNSATPTITFTGSGGTTPYKFTYKINGGTAQTITTTSGNTVILNVPTGTAGTFVYTLISVQDASITSCTNTASGSATVIINPLPSATIAGSTTICQNTSSPLITFTGSGATAPYTFIYKINNGSNQTVTTTSGNSVTVAVPTTTPGTFTYSLVSVQESSGTICTNTVSGSTIVIVNPLPTATIAGTTTVCQNSNSPLITFTGSGASAPYTFVYKINGGASQTVTTTSGNSVTVAVPTATPGAFVYSLMSVQESSSTTCTNTASGSVSVIVNQLASATIAGNTTVCQNSDSPLITFTGSGGTAPYIFTFKINGGSNQTITTTSGNNATVSVPTNAAGTFVYSLVSVQESSSTACVNAATGSATVVVNPLATATVIGTTTLCQSSTSPVITFTGSGGTAPYIFTYKINGGANQTVSTTSGNSVTVTVPKNASGTFTYSLVSVQESSSTACINIVTGSAIVTINPLPVAAILVTPNTHLCNGSSDQITISNFSSGFSYTWYLNSDSLRTTLVDTIMNKQAGVFKVQAISDKGCKAATLSNPISITIGTVPTPVITGYLKVCPKGKTRLLVLPSDSTQHYDMWRWTDPPDKTILSRDSNFSALAGQYQIWVGREGCYDSTSVTVTADDTEFPAGSLKILPDSIAYGAQATLVAAVKGASLYEWDLGNGNTIQTTVDTVLENYYTAGDSIRIKLDAISERNCITHFSGTLKVSPQAKLVIPDSSFTGHLKDWNVFPTPFHDHLKVSMVLSKNQTVKIDLFTADGSWVRGWMLAGVKGDNLFSLLTIENLPSNIVYFITGVYDGQKHFDKVYKY